jgi:hypothetical protein
MVTSEVISHQKHARDFYEQVLHRPTVANMATVRNVVVISHTFNEKRFYLSRKHN